jgi:alpha-tubulin suppressor-like RCC1 family protein
MGDRKIEVLAVGENHACGIAKGQLLCWGLNVSGQLGDGTSENKPQPTEVLLADKVVSVTAGRAHTCAVTVHDDVYCWGENKHGQLGLGDYVNRAIPTPLFPPNYVTNWCGFRKF